MSPFGRTPSANHTLLCSRVRTADGGNTHKKKNKQSYFSWLKEGERNGENSFKIIAACVRLRRGLRALKFLVVPSFPACLRTPTGTMTVGGGELSTPEAWACCRGGMVEQYSAGLLGFGLWMLGKTGVSHD